MALVRLQIKGVEDKNNNNNNNNKPPFFEVGFQNPGPLWRGQKKLCGLSGWRFVRSKHGDGDAVRIT